MWRKLFLERGSAFQPSQLYERLYQEKVDPFALVNIDSGGINYPTFPRHLIKLA